MNNCTDSPPDLPGRFSEVEEHLTDDHSDKPTDSVSKTVEFPCPPDQPINDSSVGSAQHSNNKASEGEGIEVTLDSSHTSQSEKGVARVDSVEVECESEVPNKLMQIPPRKFTVYPPRASKRKETSGLCAIC
jgi:hypothetical protein